METAHTAQTVHEHTDRQLYVALLVVYQVDALLLAGFCLAGVGHWSSPLAFAACGLLIAGGSALARSHGGAPPMSDPRRVLLQVLAAISLVLLVAWCDPPLAAMMLLTVVGVLSAAALRLAPNWLMAVALLTAVAATAVVVFHGGQLSLPVAGWAQQVMTSLFLLWTLAKAVSTHLAGTALRMQLNASHAQLATALEQVRHLAEVDELTGVASGLQVTVSVGVATSAADEPVERLLERADRGLYQAKHAGRNRVACWTASST